MEDSPSALVTRYALEVAFAVLTLAFGCTVIAGALEFSIGWGEVGPEAGYFPFRIGTVIVAASLLNLLRALRRRPALADAMLTTAQARQLGLFALPLLAFTGLSLFLGIYLAAALYLLFSVGIVARHRLPVTIGVSLGAPLLLFVLFEIVFRTPLLKGPLEAVFGWY